eukprot:EG_transcript_10448
MRGEDVAVVDPKANHRPRANFSFTATFDSCACPASEGQQQLYSAVGPQVLDNVFEGYNACLLAYGQTGSGKTYTMMGGTDTDMGLTPRLCLELFDRIEAHQATQERSTYTVEAMYYEIYNEKIFDLLAPKSKGPSTPVKVRFSPRRGTMVDGLRSHCVTSAEDVLKLLKRGNERRSTACTDLNHQSSRSHADFMLRFTRVTAEEAGRHGTRTREVTSTIHLVDLAGSERVRVTNAKGQQFEEARNINLSLSALGRVIDSLVQGRSAYKSGEVPYRDSTLTWMLRNSFGGNSKTIMIATIQPSAPHLEETLNTLRYASRAKKVVNHAVVNFHEEIQPLLLNMSPTKPPEGTSSNVVTIAETLQQKHCLQELLGALDTQVEAEREAEQLQREEVTGKELKEHQANKQELERMRMELTLANQRAETLTSRSQELEIDLKAHRERLHAAELKCAVAEAQAEGLTAQLRVAEARIAELQAEGRAKGDRIALLLREVFEAQKRIAVA